MIECGWPTTQDPESVPSQLRALPPAAAPPAATPPAPASADEAAA